MAKSSKVSIKHIEISKANTQVVIIAGLAGFLTVLCLVSSQAYISQNSYLSKVITKKQVAYKQLTVNIEATKKLTSAYDDFQNQPKNILEGDPKGEGQNDGPNSKLVLDALPSSYDFPALTSSIEKILTIRNLKVESITGIDDELAQVDAQSSPNPQAVPMVFSFKIKNATYTQVQDVVKALTLSIRPIHVDTLIITGGNTDMSLEVTAHTFYQPPKNLVIKSETVKP